MRWVALALLSVSACATPEGETVGRAVKLIQNAPEQRGDLWLRCQPADAAVEVDGMPRGRCEDFDAPEHGIRLGAGMHRVDVKKDGFSPYQTYCDPSGTKATLTVSLEPLTKAEGGSP